MLSWVQYSPAGRWRYEENGFRIEKGEERVLSGNAYIYCILRNWKKTVRMTLRLSSPLHEARLLFFCLFQLLFEYFDVLVLCGELSFLVRKLPLLIRELSLVFLYLPAFFLS